MTTLTYHGAPAIDVGPTRRRDPLTGRARTIKTYRDIIAGCPCHGGFLKSIRTDQIGVTHV